jgi:hypothetical protein
MGSYTDAPSPRKPSDLLFRAAMALGFVGIGTGAGYEIPALSDGWAQLLLLLVPSVLFPGGHCQTKCTFR